jgi:carboxyl-terminal processing protease
MSVSIEVLKSKIEGLKENFMITFSDEIKFMLKEEIVSRYYFHLGMIEASLDYDPTVVKAAELLNDVPRYNKILNK